MSDADEADDPSVDVTLSRRQELGGVAGLAALGTGWRASDGSRSSRTSRSR